MPWRPNAFDAVYSHHATSYLHQPAMISLYGEPGSLLLARAQGVELVPQVRIVGERFVQNEAYKLENCWRGLIYLTTRPER
jgi:hypothetical protein